MSHRRRGVVRYVYYDVGRLGSHFVRLFSSPVLERAIYSHIIILTFFLNPFCTTNENRQKRSSSAETRDKCVFVCTYVPTIELLFKRR